MLKFVLGTRHRWSGIGLLCFLLLTTAVRAQQVSFELDPARTIVAYSVDSTVHTVHGHFTAKSGRLSFDTGTGSASGIVIIDVTSGESGNNSRDSKMHRETLESAKYPEATFTAQHFSGKLSAAGVSNVQVSGVFNLHGKDHPLILPVNVSVADGETTAKTDFEVPYIEWGIKNPSNFFLKVNKIVKVEIVAKGRIAGVQP